MSTPLQEFTEGLRQIQHHRFLQSMVYLVLFIYGNSLFFAHEGRIAHAIAWGFVALSSLFLTIEVLRAYLQTRWQPHLRNAQDAFVTLGASMLYGGGTIYWVLMALMG
ncbi:MAG: hypothetical protein V4510_07475 [bacterium]